MPAPTTIATATMTTYETLMWRVGTAFLPSASLGGLMRALHHNAMRAPTYRSASPTTPTKVPRTVNIVLVPIEKAANPTRLAHGGRPNDRLKGNSDGGCFTKGSDPF